MLRSVDWLAAEGAEVGGTVYLDMPEMGVQGRARVAAVEPCPPITEAEGRLVSGTFRHSRGIVYDLKVEGGQ